MDNLIADNKDLTTDEKQRLQNNLNTKRHLRFALPPYTFRLMSSMETTNESWKRLKELYSGDVNESNSIQTNLLFRN